jgi:DNA-binding MarR family transcriptional regulator
MDPRNAVPIIDQLEERGLLTRRPDPDDRRRHSIAFTPKGKEAMRRLRRAGDIAERELLSTLSQSEREQLHVLLLKVSAASAGTSADTDAP